MPTSRSMKTKATTTITRKGLSAKYASIGTMLHVTLTIGERKGDYKGMLKKRNFRILVVNRQSPSGDKEPTQFSRSVRYNGKAQTIKL